ncbi:MAG TPA: hypothetical protein VN661_08980 [Candidatus Acidoferrales bacterium]|nr:hypothetical protein [Candidatus Acidoferrales bacterium]
MDQAENARTSGGDEMNALVHAASAEGLVELLADPRLDESHVVKMLERLDLPAGVIEAIARKGAWGASEAVRVRLASHPRTPKRIAIGAVRQLYLLDMVRVSLLPAAPGDIRRLAEELIVARTPHLPLGEKLTLARRGSARVAGALVAEGHPQVLRLALDNPRLTESQILRVLAKAEAPARAVAAIAQHWRWSCEYNVRLALVRNRHTPATALAGFLPSLTLRDLKELAAAGATAPGARGRVLREVQRRSARPSDDGDVS